MQWPAEVASEALRHTLDVPNVSRVAPSIWRFVLIAAATVGFLASAIGCSNDPPPTTASTADSTCNISDDTTPVRALLSCTERSVVQVLTNGASGTGVVVSVDDTTYVVTNEHVVDPFDAVDLSINGVTATGIPVVGIDAAADIAVLGPLDDDRFGPALRIADAGDLERGDEVFLIGFPGEVDKADQLESTVSQGIVSRRRVLSDYDQMYIQTDASIAGGQSGGPLFDSTGRLVGISGLSFADQFALALSGRNVNRAIARILDDGGDDYLALPVSADDLDPESGGLVSGSLEFADAGVRHQLWLPPSAAERTFEFAVDTQARPIVSVEAQGEDQPLAETLEADDINQELADLLDRANRSSPDGTGPGTGPGAGGGTGPGSNEDEPTTDDPPWADAQVEPGSFRVTVPAGEGVTVKVTLPLAFPGSLVPWTSNQPLFAMTRPLPITDVEVGSSTDAVINGFEVGVQFNVGLEAGRIYRVHAGSPQADVGFTLFNPDVENGPILWADLDVDGVRRVDDSDEGLYGLDASLTFRAATTGAYRIRVDHNDGTTIAARVTITDVTDDPASDPTDPADGPTGPTGPADQQEGS